MVVKDGVHPCFEVPQYVREVVLGCIYEEFDNDVISLHICLMGLKDGGFHLVAARHCSERPTYLASYSNEVARKGRLEPWPC